MTTSGASIDLGTLVATTIRSARLTHRWTQRDLAKRLRTNQSAISRLESPTAHSIDARLASRALTLLGVRFFFDSNIPGAANRREQGDAVHAQCVAYVVGWLERLGWHAKVEVEIGEGRARGWIDILAWRADDHTLLVIEVKTDIDDIGRILRTLGWHTRSSRAAAAAEGWRVRRIVRVLLVLATEEADARITANRALLQRELPASADALRTWLADPSPAVDGGIALTDPRSRRTRWLIRPRIQDRRSRLPYRDYRDAATRSAGTRRR